MFNRTSTVFYPNKPLVNISTNYERKDVLAGKLYEMVQDLHGRVIRYAKHPIPISLVDEFASNMWGLNTHQRPAVVTLSDVIMSRMYTSLNYKEV